MKYYKSINRNCTDYFSCKEIADINNDAAASKATLINGCVINVWKNQTKKDVTIKEGVRVKYHTFGVITPISKDLFIKVKSIANQLTSARSEIKNFIDR
jgi:hypothetical protein